MKTHTVYYVDKWGRQICTLYTHVEYEKALPDLLEDGHIHSRQYFVQAGGETKQLDYYNIYK